MYTPIEPAWQLMMAKRPEFFATARDLNVIVLGPANLLATLRIVENIWQSERSSRNVQKIVSRAGRMHDVAVRMLEGIGKALSQHQTLGKTLEQMRKSAEGSRGLVSEARQLEKLGAGGSKQLPAKESDDPEPEIIQKAT